MQNKRSNRSRLSNGFNASSISNISRSRSRSRSTSIRKVNDLKAIHVKSQKSISPVHNKENMQIINNTTKNLNFESKSVYSISEFYADQEFVEFLK